jgi:hypothetical protein
VDASYFRVGQSAWHALDDRSDPDDESYMGYCGRTATDPVEIVDRIPSEGHLCGSCGRVIAARADIES